MVILIILIVIFMGIFLCSWQIREYYATFKSLPPLNWNELDEDEGKYFYYDPSIISEYMGNKTTQTEKSTNINDIFGRNNYLRYYLDDE